MKAKVDLSYGQSPKMSPIKIRDAIKDLQRHPNDTDMWEAVDEALQEITIPDRPPESFTVTEVAAHKGISRDSAARQVAKLLRGGKIKKLGRGSNTYYVMVR